MIGSQVQVKIIFPKISIKINLHSAKSVILKSFKSIETHAKKIPYKLT